jgi:hypothetical protein
MKNAHDEILKVRTNTYHDTYQMFTEIGGLYELSLYSSDEFDGIVMEIEDVLKRLRKKST